MARFFNGQRSVQKLPKVKEKKDNKYIVCSGVENSKCALFDRKEKVSDDITDYCVITKTLLPSTMTRDE